jgi:hypothetical protein
MNTLRFERAIASEKQDLQAFESIECNRRENSEGVSSKGETSQLAWKRGNTLNFVSITIEVKETGKRGKGRGNGLKVAGIQMQYQHRDKRRWVFEKPRKLKRTYHGP